MQRIVTCASKPAKRIRLVVCLDVTTCLGCTSAFTLVVYLRLQPGGVPPPSPLWCTSAFTLRQLGKTPATLSAGAALTEISGWRDENGWLELEFYSEMVQPPPSRWSSDVLDSDSLHRFVLQSKLISF